MNTEMQLFSISRKKKPACEHGIAYKVYENKLNQDFHANAINQKWCTEFTYLFLTDGSKLHTHEPKKASIKASNIYTVDRSPKIKGSKITTTENKKFRRSTIHPVDNAKKGMFRQYRAAIKESKQSIKTKNSSITVKNPISPKLKFNKTIIKEFSDDLMDKIFPL